MNLLPKSHKEFSEKEYWDSFFKKRGSKAFEWYGEYPQLSTHLHKYIKLQDEILMAGCGNSTLGRDLYDIGYSNITNIDISNIVINQMISQNIKQRPNLKFLRMDVLDMSFEDDHFKVVLDKGTLDALMPDDTPDTVAIIKKYFSEIQRVVKLTGRYICVSLLQEHILKILLDYFPKNNWMFRIVRCLEASNDENSMPVFIIICTKLKTLSHNILEINFGSDDKMERYQESNDIITQIKTVQNAALVCWNIRRSNLQENEVSIDLYKSGKPDPRFIVHIVNPKHNSKYTEYAAFVVPQGREAEWLFSTKSGRQHLSNLTKTNRLAIVTMHRNHTYGTFEELQTELDEAICSFAPINLKKQKIPYFSLGSDVGNRMIIDKGCSEFSGDYVIEDVEIGGEKFRRLFFLNSQLVIQSEAKLKNVKTRKGVKEVIDLTFLSCRHHIYMSVATLGALIEEVGRIAVIGLGGGGLCSFLNKLLPTIKITGVEIDPEMVKVASKWFGLNKSDNLNVVIQDGIVFLAKMASEKQQFNAILFDVDSKDTTIGISCPPKQFLIDDVLQNVCKILKEDGFFILNLVLRQLDLRADIIQSLRLKFQTILSYKLAEDLNEILICSKSKLPVEGTKKVFKEKSEKLSKFLTKSNSNIYSNVDTDDLLNNLNFL